MMTSCVEKRTSLVTLLWMLVCLTALGCEKKPQSTVSVQGVVRVGSEALADGLITYVPMQGTAGQKLSSPIESGKYTITSEQGLQTGKYAVEVYGLPPSVKAMMNNEPIVHGKTGYREIAPEYNSETTLQATLVEGSNEYNFEVNFR